MFEFIALLLSVVLGVFLVLTLKPKANVVSYLLTFSGAYLLSMTLLHLLPEVYQKTQTTTIGFFVLSGLIFQIILDFFSKGVDHGHTHDYRFTIFPWTLFISLNLHAFMEGLVVSDHHHHYMLWAIIIHKLPIAMVLATFLISSKLNVKLSIAFMIIFGLMSPIGVLVGDKLLFIVQYQDFINAFIAGMFLHISTTILSEKSGNHKFKKLQFLVVISGIVLAAV